MIQRIRRPYLLLATLILLLAAFFRVWQLGTTPPGLLVDELRNAQIADRLRTGEVQVVYDELTPGREGFYYAVLAATSVMRRSIRSTTTPGSSPVRVLMATLPRVPTDVRVARTPTVWSR